MLTAVSDSFLPGMGMGILEQGGLLFGMEDGKRLLSPEETLMPPLTMQDRHPSAPQLVSMLASSIDNHKISPDVTVELDESVSQLVGGILTASPEECSTVYRQMCWYPSKSPSPP